MEPRQLNDFNRQTFYHNGHVISHVTNASLHDQRYRRSRSVSPVRGESPSPRETTSTGMAGQGEPVQCDNPPPDGGVTPHKEEETLKGKPVMCDTTKVCNNGAYISDGVYTLGVQNGQVEWIRYKTFSSPSEEADGVNMSEGSSNDEDVHSQKERIFSLLQRHIVEKKSIKRQRLHEEGRGGPLKRPMVSSTPEGEQPLDLSVDFHFQQQHLGRPNVRPNTLLPGKKFRSASTSDTTQPLNLCKTKLGKPVFEFGNLSRRVPAATSPQASVKEVSTLCCIGCKAVSIIPQGSLLTGALAAKVYGAHAENCPLSVEYEKHRQQNVSSRDGDSLSDGGSVKSLPSPQGGVADLKETVAPSMSPSENIDRLTPPKETYPTSDLRSPPPLLKVQSPRHSAASPSDTGISQADSRADGACSPNGKMVSLLSHRMVSSPKLTPLASSPTVPTVSVTSSEETDALRLAEHAVSSTSSPSRPTDVKILDSDFKPATPAPKPSLSLLNLKPASPGTGQESPQKSPFSENDETTKRMHSIKTKKWKRDQSDQDDQSLPKLSTLFSKGEKTKGSKLTVDIVENTSENKGLPAPNSPWLISSPHRFSRKGRIFSFTSDELSRSPIRHTDATSSGNVTPTVTESVTTPTENRILGLPENVIKQGERLDSESSLADLDDDLKRKCYGSVEIPFSPGKQHELDSCSEKSVFSQKGSPSFSKSPEPCSPSSVSDEPWVKRAKGSIWHPEISSTPPKSWSLMSPSEMHFRKRMHRSYSESKSPDPFRQKLYKNLKQSPLVASGESRSPSSNDYVPNRNIKVEPPSGMVVNGSKMVSILKANLFGAKVSRRHSISCPDDISTTESPNIISVAVEDPRNKCLKSVRVVLKEEEDYRRDSSSEAMEKGSPKKRKKMTSYRPIMSKDSVSFLRTPLDFGRTMPLPSSDMPKGHARRLSDSSEMGLSRPAMPNMYRPPYHPNLPYPGLPYPGYLQTMHERYRNNYHGYSGLYCPPSMAYYGAYGSNMAAFPKREPSGFSGQYGYQSHESQEDSKQRRFSFSGYVTPDRMSASMVHGNSMTGVPPPQQTSAPEHPSFPAASSPYSYPLLPRQRMHSIDIPYLQSLHNTGNLSPYRGDYNPRANMPMQRHSVSVLPSTLDRNDDIEEHPDEDGIDTDIDDDVFSDTDVKNEPCQSDYDLGQKGSKRRKQCVPLRVSSP